MNNFKFPHLQKLSVRQIIFWGLTLIFAVGLFFFVRRLTACWQLTALPGIPPSYCAANLENSPGMPDLNIEGAPNAEIPATPEVEAPQIEMPRWDGGSRINIVFFGLRGGDMSGADCPVCTDTIILLTVDPVTKTAGMLSIPRDLWVNIPGFGSQPDQYSLDAWGGCQTTGRRAGSGDENDLPIYWRSGPVLRSG